MDSALDNFTFLVWRQVVKVFSLVILIDTFWIQRNQMKDTDILFPQAPYNQILIEWFVHSDPAKLGDFCCFQDSFQCWKLAFKFWFLNSHHLKMEQLKDFKPKQSGLKYPKF